LERPVFFPGAFFMFIWYAVAKNSRKKKPAFAKGSAGEPERPGLTSLITQKEKLKSIYYLFAIAHWAYLCASSCSYCVELCSQTKMPGIARQ
jgi:hypothetical protein